MNTYIIFLGIYNPLVQVLSVWLVTKTRLGRDILSYQVS